MRVGGTGLALGAQDPLASDDDERGGGSGARERHHREAALAESLAKQTIEGELAGAGQG